MALSDTLERLNSAHRTFLRGGKFIINIFKKEDKTLSGEDCMYLFNSYALSVEAIYLLAISHEFIVNKLEFDLLLEEQKSMLKSIKAIKNK